VLKGFFDKNNAGRFPAATPRPRRIPLRERSVLKAMRTFY